MPDILGRMRSPQLASAPASPAKGEFYFNTTGNVEYVWNGTSWVTTGTTGGGTPVLAAAQISDVGVSGQIRAGRQLTAADFTALGLTAPRGLWNLSDLTDASGNARALTNKGTVTFASGINGTASTAAQFTGSTAQALYILDTGGADPFRIVTGSVGCWFRTAKRAVGASLITKRGGAAGTYSWELDINGSSQLSGWVSVDGTALTVVNAVSDIADDRWHFGVMTFDGAAIRLYADGVLEATALLSGALFASAGPLAIGVEPGDLTMTAAGTGPHFGRVDEAFVTADVLSDEQVRALYCAKVAHGFASTPVAFNLAVRRARKGGPVATTDFPSQPLRLHNFTAGVLTDQGSNNVALTNNNAAAAVSAADGAQGGAFNFVAASSQSLSATDAGLPATTAARSYGAWFKSAATGANKAIIGWGTLAANHNLLYIGATNFLACDSGGDSIVGPFAPDGQWHHGVVVEDNAAGDGVKRKLYLDGRLVGGSTVLNSITLAGANAFRVGANPTGGSPFTGQIDRAFVCGYALTEEQISILYAKASQALAPSVKNAGDHIEYADATNIYATFDTLGSQNAIDLAVTG